jgi:hypothetical protein
MGCIHVFGLFDTLSQQILDGKHFTCVIAIRVDADGSQVTGGSLQALQYWLLCAGVPTTIFLLCGHRPSGAAAGKAAKLPVETFEVLLKFVARASGVACSVDDLQGIQWTPKIAARAAVVDSLMYS